MPLKPVVDEVPVLNLTPMIDVLMLLIIFFVVGTKFIESEREIELQVPRVADGGHLPEATQRRTVTVARDGQIALDGADVTLEELTQRLAADRRANRRLGVLVRGDGLAPFQRVAAALNACRQADIRELGIVVRLAGATKDHATR